MSMKWRRVFLLSLTVGLNKVATEQRWNTSGTPAYKPQDKYDEP